MRTVGCLLLLLSTACVDDADSQDAGVTPRADAGTTTAPPRPDLGVQLDRVGRPLVTSMLLGGLPGDPQRDALSAAWNEEDDPLLWERFAPELQSALGVFDGLDGACGERAATFRSARFNDLAQLLADDRLFVDTRVGLCEQPLAVEAETLGLSPAFDCGGLTPVSDAVDAMLSLFSSAGQTLLSDGIDEDPDGAASTIVFPFLRQPVR